MLVDRVPLWSWHLLNSDVPSEFDNAKNASPQNPRIYLFLSSSGNRLSLNKSAFLPLPVDRCTLLDPYRASCAATPWVRANSFGNFDKFIPRWKTYSSISSRISENVNAPQTYTILDKQTSQLLLSSFFSFLNSGQ